MTKFEEIYNRFFGKITDDMYMEWTKEDTKADLINILADAVPGFEFPRVDLYDIDSEKQCFNNNLTSEEINILAILMLNTWLQRQITSIENTRQKYSGNDFKMTSQANHLNQLRQLKKDTETQDRHMQRLYSRRRYDKDTNIIESNWSVMLGKSALDD